MMICRVILLEMRHNRKWRELPTLNNGEFLWQNTLEWVDLNLLYGFMVAGEVKLSGYFDMGQYN